MTMQRLITFWFLVLCILLWNCEQPVIEKEQVDAIPYDWFFTQRAYPFEDINHKVYHQELHRVQLEDSAMVESRNEETLWESVGPTNIGGRVTDLVIHPNNANILFAGTSAGGIFKTTDRGRTWKPVFDKAGSLSIGSLAMASSNTRVLYAGTGEANGAADSGAFIGDGMYKSTDGGRSWQHIGLDSSFHIGRVVVNPFDENHVFVAVAGLMYGKNKERGLYETKDGGKTWKNILFVSDSTSCIDVVINPQHPNIIYAATWDRIRRPWERQYAGKHSRIYRSKDGGITWEQLTNGLAPNVAEPGRIGIAICAAQPNVLYASFTQDARSNKFEGLYKTTDGGDTWRRTNDYFLQGMYSDFGWFFGNVRVDPNNPNIVYVLGVSLMKSTDGGQSWKRINNGIHVDQHALEVFPGNSDFVVVGNDGGLYVSENGGNTWQHSKTLAITQFYECEVAQSVNNHYYGGTQDNGTVMTDDGRWGNWRGILGGDGFHVIVDPNTPDIIYAEYQWGNLFRSFDGGRNFQWARSGINEMERRNWNTPIELDPKNYAVLYYGTTRLYRSDNRASSWVAISPDLTKGQHPSGSTFYGTITAIEVSPANTQVIWVGTDDGNVQVTTNGGTNWNLVTQHLPDRYVTSIAADQRNPLKAYVTFSGYKSVDYLSHIFMTEDGGTTWQDISNNLPQVPINEVIIDNLYPDRLYLATDLGVWFTENWREGWQRLGKNLPLTVVSDLVMHNRTRTLVAATYGRSMYKLQLDKPIITFPDVAYENTTFTITPNPVVVGTPIQIRLEDWKIGTIVIYNTKGQLVQRLPFEGKSVNIVPENWQKGIYFAQIQSKMTKVTQSFLVVEE
jgi:photosystem II stability/assembly factor-like uncharacterized protein